MADELEAAALAAQGGGTPSLSFSRHAPEGDGAVVVAPPTSDEEMDDDDMDGPLTEALEGKELEGTTGEEVFEELKADPAFKPGDGVQDRRNRFRRGMDRVSRVRAQAMEKEAQEAERRRRELNEGGVESVSILEDPVSQGILAAAIAGLQAGKAGIQGAAWVGRTLGAGIAATILEMPLQGAAEALSVRYGALALPATLLIGLVSGMGPEQAAEVLGGRLFKSLTTRSKRTLEVVKRKARRFEDRGFAKFRANEMAMKEVGTTRKQDLEHMLDEVANRAVKESEVGKPGEAISNVTEESTKRMEDVINDTNPANVSGRAGRLTVTGEETNPEGFYATALTDAKESIVGPFRVSQSLKTSAGEAGDGVLKTQDDIFVYDLTNSSDLSTTYRRAAGHTVKWGDEHSIYATVEGAVDEKEWARAVARGGLVFSQEGTASFRGAVDGPDWHHQIDINLSRLKNVDELTQRLDAAKVEYSTIYKDGNTVSVVVFDQGGEAFDNVIDFVESFATGRALEAYQKTGRLGGIEWKRKQGHVALGGGESLEESKAEFKRTIKETSGRGGASEYSPGDGGRRLQRGDVPGRSDGGPRQADAPGEIARLALTPRGAAGVRPEDIASSKNKDGTLHQGSVTFSKLSALGVNAIVQTKGGRMARRTFDKFMSENQTGYADLPEKTKQALYVRAGKDYGKVVESAVLHSMKNSKSLNRLEALWATGEFRKDWYDDAMEEIRAIFGPDDELFAGFIAATSPQERVAPNIDKAIQAYIQFKTGKDFDVKLAESVHPNLERVANAWNHGDGRITGDVLSGQKVRAFLDNILGDPNKVTIDTWMGRVFGFPIESNKQFNQFQIDFIEQAITLMAERAGVAPREMQAALWVGQKIIAEGAQTMVDTLPAVLRERVIMAQDALEDVIPGTKARLASMAPLETARMAAGENIPGNAQLGFSFILGPAMAKAMFDDEQQDGKFEDRVIENLMGDVGLRGDQTVQVAGAIDLLRRSLEAVSGSADNVSRSARERLDKRGIRREYRRRAKALDKLMKVYDETAAAGELVEEYNELVRNFSARGEAQRRGIRTNVATFEAAEGIKYSEADMKRIMPGSSMNAEEFTSLTATVSDFASGKFQAQVKRAITTGDDNDFKSVLVQLRALGEYVNALKGVRAETGRALAIMNEPLKGLTDYLRQIDEIMTSPDANGGMTRSKLLRILGAMRTPEDHIKVARLVAKPGMVKAGIEVWMGALLSGPVTHMANIVSNTVMLTKTPLEYLIGGLVPGGGIPPQEGIARFAALIGGLGSSMDIFWKTLKSGAPDAGVGGSKFIEIPPAFTAEAMGMNPNSRLAHITDFFGEYVVRGSFRLLLASDEAFKYLNYISSLKGEAVRTALSEGLPRAARAERVAELLADPPPGMIKRAQALAKQNTFQKELGEVGSLVGDLSNSHPLAKIVLPFVKVPINVFKEATDLTPLALLKNSFHKELTSSDPVRRRIAQTKLTMGTTFMGYMAYLALDETITGNGPSDPALRRVWLKTHRPVSVNLGKDPATGKTKWLELGRVEPFSSVMGMAADAVQMWGYMDEATQSQIVTGLAAILAKNFTSKTFTKGLAGALKAGDNPERFGPTFVEKTIASLVPNVLNQLNTTFNDPVVKEMRSLLDRIKARVPGFSDDVPPMLDLKGEPVLQPPGLVPFSPVFMMAMKEDPVADEMMRIRLGFSQISDKIDGVELSNKENHQLQLFFLRGKARDGRTLYQTLHKVMNSSSYRRTSVSDQDRKAVLQNIIGSYRTMARGRLRRDGEVGQLLEQRIQKENTERERRSRMTTGQAVTEDVENVIGGARALAGGLSR